jgi:prepilin-type processing-associated H-X9-DG protein
LLPLRPSSRVLLACATVTTGVPTTDWAYLDNYVWSGLPHSSDPDVPGTKPFTSAHMLNAKLPAGGNLGMLDGHVEWRSFKQFIPRCNNNPSFYY